MVAEIKINQPLVSANWLYRYKDATNLVVLDATLKKVSLASQENNPIKEQIVKARFMDLKNVFSVQNAPFPNTILPAEKFEEAICKIGINKNTAIVVYDDYGTYSSARVWYLFKVMGYDNIAVLDGGLPEWKALGYAVELPNKYAVSEGNFKSNYQNGLIFDSKDVLQSIANDGIQIVDARSSERFYAREPEPRKEVRGGHIPSSKSLPYPSLLSEGKLKSKADLETIFKGMNPSKQRMIFSCGSGITACVLALGAELAGYKEYALYDGSWTEWGSLSYLPIEI